MMLKSGKYIFVLSVIALLILSSACGNIIPRQKDPVTVTIWHTYVEQMRTGMDALIEEFNSTVGKEQGIIVKVTAVANASVINEKLIAAANRDPGSPELPDMAVIYPQIAVHLAEKGILTDFAAHFNEKELARYVPEFLAEGKLGGEKVYLLPIAKSTEVLYVNKTFFDRFSKATGVQLSELHTFEGVLAAAQKYYDWTDAQTPNIPNDGKQFYYPDNLFNYTMVGFEQMGESFVEGQELNLSAKAFDRIWDSYYPYAAKGSVAIFNNYGNYLAQTGKAVCITSTLAGAIFYPSIVTYEDNTKENVEFIMLPYPVFRDGQKVAVQRGGGMCIIKSNTEKERASAVFLKWLTEPDQNIRFAVKAGYIPVMREAFDKLVESKQLEIVKNDNIRKALSVAINMHADYRFFFPPVFDGLDKMQLSYVSKMHKTAQRARDRKTKDAINSREALANFRADFDTK